MPTEHGHSETPRRPVQIIGVPMDLGQSERGTDVGPAALRYAHLRERLEQEGHQVVDSGNLPVLPSVSVALEERTSVIADVNQRLYQACLKAHDAGHFPLVLGGDHSVAMGSVSASFQHPGTGLIWVDAHADFNTPATSPSGNVHGMPLAALVGHGDPRLVNVGEAGASVAPEEVVLIGVRQLDAKERVRLRESGILTFSMRDVDEWGMSRVADLALQHLAHCARIHLSLDVDAMDPTYAPGVATPVLGGITFREMHLLMEKIADSSRLCAMDVVEVNPMLDVRNQTAKAAVALVLSALGQNIL